MQRWDIPQTWTWVAIDDIAEIIGGGTPPAKDPANFTEDGGIPWLTPADLSGYVGKFIARGRRNLSDQGERQSSARRLPAGTVLLSSRAPIGYCAIAANEMTTNQGFRSLVLPDGMSAEYVRWYLLSSRDYLESLATGTTFLELSGSKLKQVAFPLPPFAEQKRIAVKLDALSARTARARTDLARTQKLAERYKQAVLDAAFEGASRAGTVKFGDVALDIRYGTAKKSISDNRLTPVLRIPNVVSGQADLSDLKYGEFTPSEHKKLSLEEGDLILVRSNGSVTLVGRGIVVSANEVGMLYAGYLIRVRPDSSRVAPKFARLMLDAPKSRQVIESLARSTSGVNNINSKQIAALPIPLPSLDEQREIVRRIEAAFARVDAAVAEAEKALALCERLDEAVLGKAFRGELVPQDPNDEPADTLLARIRAERAAKPRPVRRGRKIIRPKAGGETAAPAPRKREPRRKLLVGSRSSRAEDSEQNEPSPKSPTRDETLEAALAQMPPGGFSFEDLKENSQLPFEGLRDAVMARLRDPAGGLEQYYDPSQRRMLFKQTS